MGGREKREVGREGERGRGREEKKRGGIRKRSDTRYA